MDNAVPVVSLGMPAFNSAKYIEQSIESLLAQTFTDFELIISNNASTDGTREICQKYAQKDSRIWVQHQDSTVDMFQNFETAYRLSQGRYFAWVGSHDLWHPEWLENLVNELDNNRSVVLTYPLTISISADGENIPDTSPLFETYKSSKLERLYKVCAENYRAGPMVHGLFRSEILSEILPASRVTLGDKQLIIETSIFGEIKQVKKDLWYRRHVVKRSSYDEILESQVDERLFGSEIPFHANFPHIAHTVSLIIKYCLAPKNQDFSHFWDGLLVGMMYWKGKKYFVERELALLDKALKPEAGSKEFSRSELKYLGDATFLEGVFRSLLGKNIDRIVPSADLHNILTLGLMIYHHYTSSNREYEIERIKDVLEKEKINMEKEKINAEYWHYKASLYRIMCDRVKKIILTK
jgi:glycosyltransferase involved in cell wall biosynthesis